MLKAIFAKHVKAIRFDEVRVGDVVGHYTDRPVEVTRISVATQEEARASRSGSPGDIRLHFGESAFVSDSPDRLIGLLGRPWARGMSVGPHVERIVLLMRTMPDVARFGIAEFDSHLAHIRTAIDQYELGKPQGLEQLRVIQSPYSPEFKVS